MADLILRPWDTTREPVTAHLEVIAPLPTLSDRSAPGRGPVAEATHARAGSAAAGDPDDPAPFYPPDAELGGTVSRSRSVDGCRGAGSAHDDTTHTARRTALAVALTDRPAAAAGARALPPARSDRPHGSAAPAVAGAAHLTSTNGLSGPAVRTWSPGVLVFSRPGGIGFPCSTL